MVSNLTSISIVCALLIKFTNAEDCFLRINELHLGANPNVKTEFIELSTSCKRPLDLTKFILVLWLGKGDGGEVKSLANFSAACGNMQKPYLILGNPEMKRNISHISTGQFCEFGDFKTWRKNQHFWIDRGNDRTNAIALYKDLNADNLELNSVINEHTAYRRNLHDVLFYKNSGAMDGLRKFLFPDYNITSRGPTKMTLYVQNDNDKPNVTEKDRHSFSFCCEDPQIIMWPLGFKRTQPSPGETNNCKDSIYTLDPNGDSYPLSLDRCDVPAIKNYALSPSRTSTASTNLYSPHGNNGNNRNRDPTSISILLTAFLVSRSGTNFWIR